MAPDQALLLAAKIEPHAAHDRQVIVAAKHGVGIDRSRQRFRLIFKPDRPRVGTEEMPVPGGQGKILGRIESRLQAPDKTVVQQIVASCLEAGHARKRDVVEIKLELRPNAEDVIAAEIHILGLDAKKIARRIADEQVALRAEISIAV